MATRRSRIQIKPNTGPRSSNKDTTEKVSSSPAKPMAIKNYERLPINEEDNSTNKDEEKDIDKSIGNSLDQLSIASSVKSVGKIPLKPDVKMEETNRTAIPPAPQNIVTGSDAAPNTSGNKQENDHDKSNNKPKENIDREDNKEDAGASKTIAAPSQRTRLRKLQPKVPDVRRLPRQSVAAQNTPKDIEKVIVTEVEPIPQVSSEETATPTEASSSSKEIQYNFSQEIVEPPPPDAHVFKKPEEPARRTSISRSNSSGPIEPNKRDVEAEPASKTTSKKSKHKESNKQKATRKPRTEYSIAEPPDKAKMTIMDLIYWNPINNPMKKVEKEEKDKKTTSEEGDVDDPDKETANKNETTGAATVEEVVPGPRVIVGEDGQITLDESSLVIEQTAPEKDLSQEVLYETSDTTYTSYSKKIFVRKLWSMRETALFYKALSVVGTDFALMAKFFPKRTRADLKRKFKKEERTRRDLLDKAVCEWHKFDLEDIQDFLFLKSDDAPADDQDREEAAVDNPENAGPKNINQYVRDNLIGKKPKGRGKEPKKVKEKPKKKGKENEKKPKEKKAAKRPLRNISSDEEIDTAEEEEMETICESQETDNNTSQECGADELCLLQTKTSKRQETMEAKRRKLDAQQAVMLQAQLKATRPLVRPPSPEPMSESLSFTVIASKTTTPPNTLSKENPHIHRIVSPPSTNSPVANSRFIPKPLATTTPGSKAASTPTSQPSTSKAEPKDVTVVQRNNLASASPVLQALLNRSSPMTLPMMNIPGASPGQFVLVASKTPTNEQVVHVYLVSPSNAASAAQGGSQSPQSQQISTRAHATAEALLRLGITLIPPQPNTELPKEETGSSEKKT